MTAQAAEGAESTERSTKKAMGEGRGRRLDGIMRYMKSYFTLFRVTVSYFSAYSAATGYLLASSPRPSMIVPVVGVFLLACGSSAFNQYQERDIDARMERTKRRPVPSGAITARHALTISLILISAGLFFLIIYNVGMIAFGLGLGAVLWYNGAYAYLKKKTAFAAVPGALVGSIPPAIGWVSGGGDLFSPRLLAFCLVFFLWQIPHFWLLILRHGKDYEEAGLPSLTGFLSKAQISRITFAWIFATAAASLSLPLYGMGNSKIASFFLFPAAVWLVWNGMKLLGEKSTSDSSIHGFNRMNGYIFIVMSLLSLDRIFFLIS